MWPEWAILESSWNEIFSQKKLKYWPTFVAIFEIIIFYGTAVAIFWATYGKIGPLLISTSGHTVLVVDENRFLRNDHHSLRCFKWVDRQTQMRVKKILKLPINTAFYLQRWLNSWAEQNCISYTAYLIYLFSIEWFHSRETHPTFPESNISNILIFEWAKSGLVLSIFLLFTMK